MRWELRVPKNEDSPAYPCAWKTSDGKPCRDDLLPEIRAAMEARETPNLNLIEDEVPRLRISEPSDEDRLGYAENDARFLIATVDEGSARRRRRLLVRCTNCKHLWAVELAEGSL